MTLEEHLNIVLETQPSRNKKSHEIECDYIYIDGNTHELTKQYMTGM